MIRPILKPPGDLPVFAGVLVPRVEEQGDLAIHDREVEIPLLESDGPSDLEGEGESRIEPDRRVHVQEGPVEVA